MRFGNSPLPGPLPTPSSWGEGVAIHGWQRHDPWYDASFKIFWNEHAIQSMIDRKPKAAEPRC